MMVVMGASAAAAAEHTRRQQEEETMSYTPQDLSDGWEFKIIRTTNAGFRKPERLRDVLAEEAHAGWELLEKLDDSHIRLKRPTSRRQLDGKLDFDPYRTQVGIGAQAWLVFGVALGISILLLMFMALMVRVARAPDQQATVEPPPPVILHAEEKPGPQPLRPPSIVIPQAR